MNFKKNLKDLFLKERTYIITIPYNNKYYLYIEGLCEYGGCIINNNFDIKEIKTFCIEIIEKRTHEASDYSIDTYNLTLDTTIKELFKKVSKEL